MDTKRKVIALESFGASPNNIKEGGVYTVVEEWDDYVKLDGLLGWWGITSFKPYVDFFKTSNDPEHPVIDLTKVVNFYTIKKPADEINPTIGVAESKDPHEGIVTKPPHYTRWAIEPVEFLYRNRVEGHIFNIVKYSMRAGHKLYPGMDAVQSEIVDLKKAARYIEMRINLLEGKEVL
jgi:hypothetical protein